MATAATGSEMTQRGEGDTGHSAISGAPTSTMQSWSLDMPAPDTVTRRMSALQASMGSVSTLSSCTSAT
jgi:hypothetical protein